MKKYCFYLLYCIFLLSCSDSSEVLGEDNQSEFASLTESNFDSFEEQCSCDRFYLEGGFAEYIKEQLGVLIQGAKVPTRCFTLALKRAELQGGPFNHSGYLRCEDQKPKECLVDKNCAVKSCKYASRPCVNQTYVKVLRLAFLEVNKCLGIDLRLSFPLYVHESQLHLSRRSWTGALCSGQMTSIAVEDINRRGFAKYKARPSCAKVFTHFKLLKTKIVKDHYRMLDSAKCGITSNPYTCFMYSLLFYQSNLNRMQKLKSEFALSSIFKSPEKVLESVGIWSYNGGYGVIRILKLYLDAHKLDKNISFLDFWKDFKINWIAKYYKWGGPTRVREVQNFAEKVARDLIKAPNSPEGELYIPGHGKQGVLCSSPSSFVNDIDFIKAIMER